MAYILSDQCNIQVRVSVFSGLDKSAPLFSVKEFGNTCILYSMDKILEYGDTMYPSKIPTLKMNASGITLW